MSTLSRVVPRPLVILGASVVAGLLVGLVGPDHEIIPVPILLEAIPFGAIAALHAVAIVLIYRAARIVNFAHASVALVASVIFLTMRTEQWSWWIAAPAAIAAAVAVGLLLEASLIRRFADSPRLVLTVVTIAAGQILAGAAFIYPSWRFGVDVLNADQQEQNQIPQVAASSPFTSWRRDAFPTVFTGDHLLAVVLVLVALLGLGQFLRRTTTGVAVRAASENSERLGTLGLSTGKVGSVVWAAAAALAGLAAVLGESLNQGTILQAGTGLGTAALLRPLAAAVLARFDALPTAAAAAIGITIFSRCVFWAYGQSTFVDVAMLGIIGVGLAVQRRDRSRADDAVTGGWAAAEEVRPVPAVLLAHPTVQAARRWAITVGVGAVLLYPFAGSPSQVVLGSTYAIFGIVGISLVVLTGWGGQISLGQFGLVAVGAVVAGTASASWHLPFVVALGLGVVGGALVAVVLGLPALRIKGLFLAVMTLAFAVAFSSLMSDPSTLGGRLPKTLGRPELGFISFEDDRAFYFLSLAALIVTVIITNRLRRSRTGRVLIAMRDNERAAQALSLSTLRVRLVTFAVAGAIAGGAGGLLAFQQSAVRPSAYTATESIDIFLMAVIGGLGSVGGVLTGALYLGTMKALVGGTIGQLLASGGGVILVLVFYPSGLGGAVYGARDAFLRRIALREKIWVPSILGDVRTFDPAKNLVPLADRADANGSRTTPPERYRVEGSTIQDAGKSQLGKGWIYG